MAIRQTELVTPWTKNPKLSTGIFQTQYRRSDNKPSECIHYTLEKPTKRSKRNIVHRELNDDVVFDMHYDRMRTKKCRTYISSKEMYHQQQVQSRRLETSDYVPTNHSFNDFNNDSNRSDWD